MQILGLEPQIEIQQWRNDLLNGLFFALLIPGAILITTASLNALQNRPQQAPVIISVFACIYLVIVTFAFVRKIPYALRSGMLLALIFGLALYDVTAQGLASDGRHYMFTGCLLTALLVGRLASAGAAGVSIVAFTLIAWLQHRWVPTVYPSTPNPTLWLTISASLLLHMTTILTCTAYILQRMSKSLGLRYQAVQRAETNAVQAQQLAESLAAQKQQLEATEQQLRSLVHSLEIATIDITDQIVLAPLVGHLDAQRAQAITARLLEVTHTRRVKLMIIDVAALPDADAQSVKLLAITVDTLRLLGCRVIITGFSPDLAVNSLEMEHIFTSVEVRRSPQEVIEMLSGRSLRDLAGERHVA
ncbi:MAG: STAS domain-containing protein [Oscillochloris sp.]|nr:STAS domain-containing protein [Oscillochloris sp.]